MSLLHQAKRQLKLERQDQNLKHLLSVISIARTKDGKETWGCYCNAKKVVTDVDSYCPMGEKRGNEDDKQ